MTGPLLPIITYHAIGAAASPLFTPVSKFEAQIAFLARSGYCSVSLPMIINRLRAGQPLPDKAVALTFDDGYESVYTEAWPRLKHYGLGATVFVVSDYCGRANRWPGQPQSIPSYPLLTWDQVAALADEGCEFGAHTRSHPVLPSLPLERAYDEIVGSKNHIEKRTGQPVQSFAHPYGATSLAVENLVRSHFEGAASTRLGLVGPGSDPYNLERIDAFYLAPALISLIESPIFRYYLYILRSLRSLRRWFKPDWFVGPVHSAHHV